MTTKLFFAVLFFQISISYGQYKVTDIENINVDTIKGKNHVIVLIKGTVFTFMPILHECSILRGSYRSKIIKVYKGKLRLLGKDSIDFDYNSWVFDDDFNRFRYNIEPNAYYIMVLKRKSFFSKDWENEMYRTIIY